MKASILNQKLNQLKRSYQQQFLALSNSNMLQGREKVLDILMTTNSLNQELKTHHLSPN